MKTKFFSMLLTISLLLMASCDSWIDPSLNIDPSNPEDASMDVILPTIEAGYAYQQSGDLMRYVSVFTQHHKGVDRQHAGIWNYVVKEDDMGNAWLNMYTGPMMDMSIVIKKADELDSPHYKGVAQIWLAMAIGIWTDFLGPIPYTEAFEGQDNINPGYDSQEEIYNSIFSLLDNAVTNLNAGTSVFSPSSEDMIYGGDRDEWIKAAYTLKARYYLHLKQYNDALTALNNGFMSNDDNLTFNFQAKETEANPLYQFDDQRGDIRLGPLLTKYLNDWNDPRKTAFAGSIDSLGMVEVDSDLGPYYASINSPTIFISYMEAKFIEAECQLAVGTPADAYDAYMDGIKASLALYGATSEEIDTYVAQPAVDVGEGNLTLENIIIQKYIALYTNPETWTDWRRTNYPTIVPPSTAILPETPRRFPYPQSERIFNRIKLQESGYPIPPPSNYPEGQVWWDATFWN